MAFCVMNVKKNGRGAVYGLQIEANREPGDGREFDLSDIDRKKTKDNIHLRRCENWNTEITREIRAAGVKERKDSVVLLTGVYTASPEFFETHNKDEWLGYFRACLDFHDSQYGKAFNAVVHLDEQTPHLQVASVPIVRDEKGAHLSAKIIIGNRADMQRRQDLFFEQVGKGYGLDRGERREPAETKAHTTKREWQIGKQREELEQLEKQKVQALRELDKARAGEDYWKAIQKAAKSVLTPVKQSIEVLYHEDAKRTFTGKLKPETVTIRAEDYKRLQDQATANRATLEAAKGIDRAVRNLARVASEANINQVDRQSEAARKERARADELETELERTRGALTRQQEKTEELSGQVEQYKDLAREYRDMQRLYPDEIEYMQNHRKLKSLELALSYQECDEWGDYHYCYEGEYVRETWLLREYERECRKLNEKPNRDIGERLRELREQEFDLMR